MPLTQEHRELYNIIHILFWRELGEFPNLIDCRDYNDKIQWLKLFDQNQEIIRCSDKILIRDYVRERVGDQYLVKLYQVHDRFKQIDFDALPNSFVIKVNHDSGTVILVPDKELFDPQEVENRIKAALSAPYGWQNGEWAYSYVQPKVFVEEFIEPESKRPQPDFKFHCVNGKMRWLQYVYDRGNSTKESIILPTGEITSIHFDSHMQHKEDFTLPKNWDEIKNVAERLAYPFKYVRVDMYCVDQKIYVGECTFYPLMGCYKGEGQKILGQLLDFDRSTCKPFLLTELEAQCSRYSLYPNSKNES